MERILIRDGGMKHGYWFNRVRGKESVEQVWGERHHKDDDKNNSVSENGKAGDIDGVVKLL